MIFKKIDSNRISAIGIGTAMIGGRYKPDYSHDSFYVKTIKQAIRLGLTHIDTAEIYGGGHTEELVGRAIKGFKRNELFITTKVWKNNLSYQDVIKSAEGSLDRMGISYIDLYLIHFPNPDIPLKETMRGMNDLIENGTAKFIGVSNFSLPLLKKAQKLSKNRISANQIKFNLIECPDSKMLVYALRENILLIAYRPLAGGILSKPRYRELVYLSKMYNKSYSQIALNWLSSKPGVVAIPKATKTKHLLENASSVGWNMNDEHIAMLDSGLKPNRKDAIYKAVDCFHSRKKLIMSIIKG